MEQPLKPRSVTYLVAIFMIATVGAYAFISHGFRISSALVYVVGVMLIAAASGLRGGLTAAFGASIIYNVMLSPPIFHLTRDNVDDLVPLVAFNASAVVSGILAGRLNDRARAAEDAQRRISDLLSLSDKLQTAFTLEEIAAALEEYAPLSGAGRFTLHRPNGVNVADPTAPALALVGKLVSAGLGAGEQDKIFVALLEVQGEIAGALSFARYPADRTEANRDMTAYINIIRLAVERSFLLDSRSDAVAIEKSNAFKTAILASASHDMRTPLSAIAASISSLISFEQDLDEATKMRLMLTIQQQGERLSRYTNNLLDLGKIESGATGKHLAPVDVVEILALCIAQIKSAHPDRRIERDFHCSTATVLASAVMAEQIFSNILDNAVKFSDCSSVVSVTACQVGSTVELGIRDRGCGIAQSEKQKVFERFYRGTNAPMAEGSGLGLTIAKGFVDVFNGSIGIESDSQGTLVTVSLPLAASA